MTTVSATVASFDEADGARLIRDDGTDFTASTDAVVAGGFRFVRSGQRVSVEVDERGTVTRVSLPHH